MLRTHTQAQSELNQREFLSRDRLRSLLGLLSLTPRAVTHLGPRTARVTPVSYPPLTLPTNLPLHIAVVEVALHK